MRCCFSTCSLYHDHSGGGNWSENVACSTFFGSSFGVVSGFFFFLPKILANKDFFSPEKKKRIIRPANLDYGTL